MRNRNTTSSRALRGATGVGWLFLAIATPLFAAEPPAAGVVLTGDTSEPVLSTFVQGEPVELRFSVAGLAAGQEVTLRLRTLDEHDVLIAESEVPMKADEHGKWTGAIPGTSERFGFRRVEAELSDGTKLQPQGTRKGSYLTYAVVPDPAKRPDYGAQRSRFGMQGGFGREWGNRSLSLLGARWVLDGNFEWRRNEPNKPGEYAAALEKNPVTAVSQPWRTYALPTLMATPKWAAIPETFSYMTGTLKPEYEQAWVDYCRLATRTFMAKYPEQNPRVYQITWEPQIPWGYKGRLQDIVRIYELAYPVIHDTDPHAIVAGPTLGLHAMSELQTTSDLMQLGLASYLDGYTTHPYFPLSPEKADMVRHIRIMKRVLASTGKKLPMYGTEQGGSTFEKRELELQHARALIRQNLITLGEGFAVNMTYYIVDYYLANQSGYGYYYNLVDKVPWGPAKAGPRPVVPAYAAQSLLLDGADGVRAINWLGDTAWGYAFERDGDVILALWDYGDAPREVDLPVGADQVEVYDWMGNARRIATSWVERSLGDSASKTKDRVLRLELGPEPVYVTGVSSSIWGRSSAEVLTVSDEDITATPDGELSLNALVRAENEAIDGMVLFQPDARLGIPAQKVAVNLARGESQSVSAALQVPANVEPGDYPVSISLVAGNATLALAGQWLAVVPPVAIERVVPLTTENGIAMSVSLQDVQGRGRAGQMQIAIPRLLSDPVTVPYRIEPGATSTVVVPLPDAKPVATRKYAVNVSPLAATPDRYAQMRYVNWLQPPALSTRPEIDADLSEWSAIAPYPAGKGSALRLGWDPQTLYVAIETQDETFIQNWDIHNTARGDSIVLNFNIDPHRKTQASGNELADASERPRTSRFTVALTRNGPEVYRHNTPDADKLPTGHVPAEQIRAAIRRDGEKTIYEMAISFASLGGGDIAPGQLVGTAIEVRDLDVEDWHKCVGTPVFQADDKEADNSGLLQFGLSR